MSKVWFARFSSCCCEASFGTEINLARFVHKHFPSLLFSRSFFFEFAQLYSILSCYHICVENGKFLKVSWVLTMLRWCYFYLLLLLLLFCFTFWRKNFFWTWQRDKVVVVLYFNKSIAELKNKEFLGLLYLPWIKILPSRISHCLMLKNVLSFFHVWSNSKSSHLRLLEWVWKWLERRNSQKRRDDNKQADQSHFQPVFCDFTLSWIFPWIFLSLFYTGTKP